MRLKTLKEHRTFSRFSMNLLLRFLPHGHPKEGQAQAVNICANGINFISKTKLSTNTLLEMWLALPFQIKLAYLVGRVRWTKKFNAGIPYWHTGVYIMNGRGLLLHLIKKFVKRNSNAMV